MSQPSDRRVSDEIRLLSYNLLADHYGQGWERRRDVIHKFVSDGRFDILAIQEVTERQIADLAKRHPNLQYIVGERSDGHRGDQPWYEFNPIFYDPDRFSLEDHSSFWISETPTKPGSILPNTKNHARVLTWALLRDRRTSKQHLIINTHIHGLRGREEVGIILARLLPMHRGEPVIFAGDFNFVPTSPGYAHVTKEAVLPFVDSFAFGDPSLSPATLIGPDGSTFDGSPEGLRERAVANDARIDYVFTCGYKRVSNYATPRLTLNAVGHFASDHHPITVTLGGAEACQRRR